MAGMEDLSEEDRRAALAALNEDGGGPGNQLGMMGGGSGNQFGMMGGGMGNQPGAFLCFTT